MILYIMWYIPLSAYLNWRVQILSNSFKKP